MMAEERQPEAAQQLRRLCSEIQLFDLCDLESCSHRQGRFCTRKDLLVRFEHIADEDECAPLRNALSDSGEEDEYDDGAEVNGYGADNDDEECYDGDDEREE